MKKLVTTTAIGLMLALPVSVQAQTSTDGTATTGTAQVDVQAQSATDMFFKMIPHSITASGLIGKRVYVSEEDMSTSEPIKAADQNWDDIGEVSDVVLGMDGSVDAVLVDVGGFLGMGEKTVAISMNSLRLIPDGDTENAYFVVVKGDKAMLDAAPTYEGNMSQQVMDSSETEATAMENTAATAASKAEDGMEQAGDNAEAMATNAAEKTKQMASDTGQTVKNAADSAGEATKDAAAKTGSAIDNAVDSTAAAVGMTGQADATDGVAVDIATLDADTLHGEGVYGPNDDKVGDISKLVKTSDGKLEGVVIDVGGFIGIGAKPVEIKANQLTVLKNDTSMTVHTGLTEEQLKSLPKYEE
ncbi:PRC-barrel domain-containing protein [Thioclava sp.]|uniref:PRC-barrel domain-containing protein n=1 Tax=Thioclava sp. TaxID=1933450 RepID=UPI003AA8E46D